MDVVRGWVLLAVAAATVYAALTTWLLVANGHVALETDHLDGVLFVDRLDAETKRAALKAVREAEWSQQPVPVVKQSPHPLFGRAL